MNRIELVEPTFEGESGHCRDFLASLCRASIGSGFALRVFAGKGARLPEIEGADCEVVRHFSRRLRRLQAYFLYRRLLRGPGRILVATAGRTDMILLDLASRGKIPPSKAFLYFHWVRPSPGKLEFFRKIAGRHPDLVLMGPTPGVTDVFRECGFRDVRTVPYPVTSAVPPSGEGEAGFRHILYAGAARPDKGFGRVVDLVRWMDGRGETVPVTVQASADHYAKFDPATRAEIARLREGSIPWLRILPETLAAAEYRRLFEGAVCLQPYDRNDFADRISGITLDAFRAGAPVVATAGTWMARMAARFDAGIAVEDLSPPSLFAAVESLRAEYASRRGNALEGGRILQEEHSARHLFSALATG